MTRFLLRYIRANAPKWSVRPVVHAGAGLQDCIVLAFGKPRTAIMAHMDSVGFTVRYNNGLVRIGSPDGTPGSRLTGRDSRGAVSCSLQEDGEGRLFALADRIIDPGTDLTFRPGFRSGSEFVQSPYLDNRLGVWVALRTCETLRDGLVIFSCYEEHGGGTAGYLARFAADRYGVSAFLICDITWVTDGVHPGQGTVVSLRDKGIPRRSFVDRVAAVLTGSRVRFQREVEGAGGSDGTEIQHAPLPADWCFVGAPESNVHSPDEKVHLADVRSMRHAYRVLMRNL